MPVPHGQTPARGRGTVCPVFFWNETGCRDPWYRGELQDRVLRVIAQRWQGPAQSAVAEDARLPGLRAGDAAVIEAVLVELLPQVRRWVYRRLGPDMAVDDVTQEALTEIARALPRFEGHCSVAAYAYRITAHAVARALRKRSAQRGALAQARPVLERDADTRDPERSAAERQALRVVLACLARLPAKRREVFTLCELEGATPEQAAELLGTTPNAVRSLLMHARRELDRRLRGHDALTAYRGQR